MSNRKQRSVKAAFGGVVAAMSIVLMFMTGVIPSLTYAIPAVSGALLMALVVEIGPAFAATVYFSVALLSLFVVADKEAAVMYALFFGYYPIIKGLLEKRLKGFWCWLVKYVIFNIAVITAYFIITKILLISFDDMASFGKWAMPLLLLAGNIVFFIYDIALTRLITAYLLRLRKYVRRIFK